MPYNILFTFVKNVSFKNGNYTLRLMYKNTDVDHFLSKFSDNFLKQLKF